MKRFIAPFGARQSYIYLFGSFIFLLATVCPLIATEIFWTNTAGGNWSAATNWSPNTVPNSSHDVFITNSGTYTVTFDIIGGVSNLTLGGASGTQTLSNSVMYLTIFGAANIWSNGVLSYGDGDVAGTKTVNAGGMIVWSGGDMDGPLTIATNGTLEINPPAMATVRLLSSGTITNYGTTAWRAGTFSVQGLGFYNQAGGVLDIQGDPTMCCSSTLLNAADGIIRKTAGTNTSTLQLEIINDGVMTNFIGTLAFIFRGTNHGTVVAEAGATNIFNTVPSGQWFNLDGTFIAGAGGANKFIGRCVFDQMPDMEGPGTNDTRQMTAYFTVPITDLTLNGDLEGTNLVTGTLTLAENGSIGGVCTVSNGATLNVGSLRDGVLGYGTWLTNHGTMNVESTNFTIHSAPGFESFIVNHGVFDIQRDGFIGAGTLLNAPDGIIRKTAGTNTSTLQLEIINDGVMTNFIGTLAFIFRGTNHGTVVAEAGATNIFNTVPSGQWFNLDGTFIAGAGGANKFIGRCVFDQMPDMEGPGTNDTRQMTAYFTVPITDLTLNGDLEGTNLVTGTLTLAENGSIGGVCTVSNGATLNVGSLRDGVLGYGTWLTNHGTMNVESTNFTIHSAPGFESFIVNHGVFDIQRDGFIGAGTLLNAPDGIIRKTAGTNTSTLQMTVENAGVIEAHFGTLELGQYYFVPLNLLPTSVLDFVLSGPTPGSQYGRIKCGLIQLQFDGELKIDFANGFVPDATDVGQRFNLITSGAHDGGFYPFTYPDLSAQGLILVPHGEPGGLMVEVISTNAVVLPPVTNLMDADVAFGGNHTWPDIRAWELFTSHAYQWLSNEVVLVNETNAMLTVTNVQTTNTYRVVLDVTTNLYSAVLRPLRPPFFITKPAGQSVTNGADVSFSASIGGDGPFTYQWLLNGSPIAEATSPALTLNRAQPTDSGNYSLTVANRVGRTNSSPPAELFVEAPGWPFADYFTNAVATNGLSFVVAGTNSLATFEPGEPEHADYGTNSVWLKWMPPADGFATITMGGSVDMLLGIYTNPTNGTASVTNLLRVDADDDSGRHLMPRSLFNVKGGSNYWFAVAGFWSQGGRFVLSVIADTNITTAPQIPPSGQPAGALATPGGTATFSVFATSTTNLSYRWIFNDALANPSWTNATLILTNVSVANVGQYRVVVSTPDGKRVSSDAARLELSGNGAFTYDKLSRKIFFGGGPLNLMAWPPGFRLFNVTTFPSVSVGQAGLQTFSTFGSTSDPTEPAISDTLMGGPTRWYQLTATNNGTLVIDTVGSQFDTMLGIFTGDSVFNMLSIASDDNGAGDGKRSLVRFDAKGGTNYIIGVSGVNGESGTIAMNWRMGIPPAVSGSPTTNTLNQPASLTLTAGVTNGNPSPRYQWYVNGVAVSGATNSSYVITNVLNARQGAYGVIASNLVGTANRLVGAVNLQIPFQLVWDGTANPSSFRVQGISTQATVLQMSTNLTFWQSIFTNTDSTLPINFLDTNSATRGSGFYKLKPWP